VHAYLGLIDCDLTISIDIAAPLCARFGVECVQDIRNRINRKVERFPAFIHKLRIAPPPYIEQPFGRIHASLHRCQTWCRALFVERDQKNIISNEIQNTDVTMTEEDIEYIRQMLEEDREILVKLS
jgi:hypothetical protein